MNKVRKILAAGALLAASGAPLGAAAAVNVDVIIGWPGYTTYVAPPPAYYYPPAVYYSPPAVYYAPAPRPIYRHEHWERRWDRHSDRHWDKHSEKRWDREYRHDDRRRW